MAAVEITISGVLYDKQCRTTRNVVLTGEATLAGLGAGGGPIIPGGGQRPPGIWGGPIDPYPDIGGPGPQPPHPPPLGTWGGGAPWPGYAAPPIYIPPSVPPIVTPPTPPSPGDPTTIVPPPAGSPGWPVHPVAVPPYMVVWYPGIGPIVVPPPLAAQPRP
jgi:hypothetical protein